jgi:hypothetical protein
VGWRWDKHLAADPTSRSRNARATQRNPPVLHQITQASDGHMDPCRCLVTTLDDDMDACRTCAGVLGATGAQRLLVTVVSRS